MSPLRGWVGSLAVWSTNMSPLSGLGWFIGCLSTIMSPLRDWFNELDNSNLKGVIKLSADHGKSIQLNPEGVI